VRTDEQDGSYLHDSFSDMAAAALQMQHALEVSEEDTWTVEAAQEAQHLHKELVHAASRDESAQPDNAMEGAMHEFLHLSVGMT
jgi:hypothetical protein